MGPWGLCLLDTQPRLLLALGALPLHAPSDLSPAASPRRDRRPGWGWGAPCAPQGDRQVEVGAHGLGLTGPCGG